MARSGRPAQYSSATAATSVGSPPATRNPIPARGCKDRHAHHCNDHLPARGSRQAHDRHVGKKRRRQRQTSGIAADLELRTQRQDEKGRGDCECEPTTEDRYVMPLDRLGGASRRSRTRASATTQTPRYARNFLREAATSVELVLQILERRRRTTGG